jgi:hypothetical protein
MSIETATQRLRDANPAPDTNLLRSETEDLTALLHATWQRSTNVQTQQHQKLAPVKEPQKRGWLIAAAVAAATIIVIGAVALLPLTQGTDTVTDTPSTTLDAAPVPTTVASVVAPPTTVAVVPAGPTTFVVEAFDYGYEGLPAEFTAGDVIELVNTSDTEYHMIAVIRLDDDDARSIEEFAALPVEAFGGEIPQPGFDIIGGLHAAPGEGAFNGRIRLQTPGRYLVIDMVRQGADPVAVEQTVDPVDPGDSGGPPYDVDGGPLGYQHGMIAIVTVVSK